MVEDGKQVRFFEKPLPIPPSLRQLVATAASEQSAVTAEKRRSTRGALLHRSQWLPTVMREHPDLLELHECLRPLTAAESFARTTRPARTAVKDMITKEGITNLILQHVTSLGLTTTAKILTEEANAHCMDMLYVGNEH